MCSRLVGRDSELAELDAALADAEGGSPALVFVAGESGVGKTRLLVEFAARARARGARVEAGDCVELGGEELPYAPLVAVLRGLARQDDPVFERLSPAARAQLGALLPELLRDARAPAPETAQARVFEALLTLLDLLAREQVLVLVIEDLHWADHSTRAFLTFLARSLWTERILLVATFRPDELHRRHPLRPVLAALEQEDRSRRITLAPFTERELAVQLDDIVGVTDDPELVARVFRRSEGNPLFTEELLAAGLDGRGALPATLRDALMVRVERLGEQAQELLRVLAAGRRVTHDVLADASGLEPAAVRAAVREAAEAHLVEADETGRYRFRHALLREVIADDLLPGEHAELHLALARALEPHVAERPGDVELSASLAHHYLAAGDQPAALVAAVRAASAADAVRAYAEAAGLLERALEIWDRVPDAPALVGATRADLLLRFGTDLTADGDHERAQAAFERALGDLGPGADAHAVARIIERLTQAQWRMGRADDAVASITRGLALLPDDESPERARLTAHLAKDHMIAGRFSSAVPVGREALDLARRAGDAEAEAAALMALGVSLIETGDLGEGRDRLWEAIGLATTPSAAVAAYVNLADALHVDGRSEEALDVALEGLERLPASERADTWLETTTTEIEWALGAWERARERATGLGRHDTGPAGLFVSFVRAEIALADGDADTATALLDRGAATAAELRQPRFVGWYGTLRARVARRAGDAPAARGALDHALTAIGPTAEDRPPIAELAQTGVEVEADAAQRARDVGDEEGERLATGRAEAHVAQARRCADPPRPVEVARLATAEAEFGRARGAPDPEAFAAAADRWRAVGRPYHAALAEFGRAEALAGAGDRDGAQTALDEVLRACGALGAPWLEEQARGLAARARLSARGPVEQADVEPEPEDPFGLTPRERQVLELLARGATNREIGDALFMAEKTASVHVSRILAKLDVRTRTQAAAVAHRAGLVA